MSIKGYSIKDIADMTCLPIAKIRTLIKNGAIKAEMKEAICGKRRCKRLEVTEEDLASFALSNPELAGNLMNMEFIRKYDVKKADDVDHDVNEEIGEKPDNGWGPAEFTDDDLADNGEVAGGDDNNEDVNIPDTPTAIFADESGACASDDDRIMSTLRKMEQTYIDSIQILDNNINDLNARIDALNDQRNSLAVQLLDLQYVIEYITNNGSNS